MRIKEVIREKGSTVKDVARRMGVSSPSLSQTISGNPTIEKLQQIASALNVPVSELIEHPSLKCPYCGKKIRLSKED